MGNGNIYIFSISIWMFFITVSRLSFFYTVDVFQMSFDLQHIQPNIGNLVVNVNAISCGIHSWYCFWISNKLLSNWKIHVIFILFFVKKIIFLYYWVFFSCHHYLFHTFFYLGNQNKLLFDNMYLQVQNGCFHTQCTMYSQYWFHFILWPLCVCYSYSKHRLDIASNVISNKQ